MFYILKKQMTNEIQKLFAKYTELDKAEQSVEAWEVLQDLKHLNTQPESVEKLCLRCWVEHKEVKREWSNGCSCWWHYYPKHLRK